MSPCSLALVAVSIQSAYFGMENDIVLCIFQIVCLDLSDNKLFKLEILKGLVSKTPGLTMLNFSNNKVRFIL